MTVYEVQEWYHAGDGTSHSQTVYAFSTRESANRCAELHPGFRVIERTLDVFVDQHQGLFYWYVCFLNKEVTVRRIRPTMPGSEIAFCNDAWVWADNEATALVKAMRMRAEAGLNR